MNPFFSIIIPTHNRHDLLGRALKSVKNLQLKNYEIIVISDNNDMYSFLIANDFISENDIFLKRNGICGPSLSRNAGIKLARGEYIIFLDDDDELMPDLLDSIINKCFHQNVIYWNYQSININSINDYYTNSEHFSFGIDYLYVKNFIPNNCIAVPRTLALNTMFDCNLQSHEDWDFLLSLLSFGGKFVHVPIFGSRVHEHGDSSRRNHSAMMAGQWPKSYIQIYGKWSTKDSLKELRQVRLKELGVSMPVELL